MTYATFEEGKSRQKPVLRGDSRCRRPVSIWPDSARRQGIEQMTANLTSHINFGKFWSKLLPFVKIL
jgi:hypothetical protein